jgi:hypothetical protein
MYELNIESICAHTSQAKGRVERANLTLQDRLVKELRWRNLNTQEAANASLMRIRDGALLTSASRIGEAMLDS